MAIEIRVHKKFRGAARVQRARLKRVARRAWNAENERGAASRRGRALTSGGGAHATRVLGRGNPSRKISKPGLTIYITTDSEMRLLNRKFHGTNATTDVLSFPARQRTGESATHLYLGDIVISYDRARLQARAARWSIAKELDLLAVHGVLHLLGEDDSTPRARKKMWKRQEKILGKVNK